MCSHTAFMGSGVKFVEHCTRNPKIVSESLLSHLIEHSKNNLTIVQSGLFENDIRHGVLQPSVQKTFVLQEPQRHKAKATHYISIL